MSQYGSQHSSQFGREGRGRQSGEGLSNQQSRDRLRKRHKIDTKPESPRSTRSDKEGRERGSNSVRHHRGSQDRNRSKRRPQGGAAVANRSSSSARPSQSNRLSQPSQPELRLRAPKRPRPQGCLSPDERRRVAERELAAGRPGNNSARGLEAKRRASHRRSIEGRSPSQRAISHRETDPLASANSSRRLESPSGVTGSQKRDSSRKAAGGGVVDRRTKEQREPERKYLERKAKHRLYAAKLTIVLTMLTVVLGLLGWGTVAFINSGLFYPSGVEVHNAHFLSIDDVINIAAVDMQRSTITMDTNELERRLMAHPWIMRANVTTRFPNQVVIEVSERTPAVELEIDGARGRNWVASSDGVWLGHLSERGSQIADPTGSIGSVSVGAINVIPVSGIVELDPEWGERVDDESLLNVLAHLRGLDSRIISRVSRVSAPEVGRTSLFTIDEVELDVGRADNLAEKSTIILTILEEEEGNVVLINVRSIHNATWRGHSR